MSSNNQAKIEKKSLKHTWLGTVFVVKKKRFIEEESLKIRPTVSQIKLISFQCSILLVFKVLPNSQYISSCSPQVPRQDIPISVW